MRNDTGVVDHAAARTGATPTALLVIRTETDATDCSVKTQLMCILCLRSVASVLGQRSLLEMVMIVQLVEGHVYFKFFDLYYYCVY